MKIKEISCVTPNDPDKGQFIITRVNGTSEGVIETSIHENGKVHITMGRGDKRRFLIIDPDDKKFYEYGKRSKVNG